MARRKQVFVNSADQSLIIFLEPSTSTYRLEPGEELVLFYDDDDTGNGPNTPLRIEYLTFGNQPQITVWTGETVMFLPDGSEAPMY